MRPRARSLWLLALALCLPPARAQAYSGFGRKAVGTSGAQFLKLPVSARAIAMGEAYTAVADGAEAVYWNASGLERVPARAFSLMHAAYLQGIYYDFAAYAQRVPRLGVFALGFQYQGTPRIDETDEFGTARGTYRPYDLAASLGWARKFQGPEGSRFILGAAAKFIQSKIIDTARTGAVDLSASASPVDKLWLSAAVLNLGSGLKFSDEEDPLPLAVKAGASYRLFHRLLIALDASFPRDNHASTAMGAEYVRPVLKDAAIAARAGFNSRNLTDIAGLSAVSAGAGLEFKTFQADFAWTPFGAIGNSYRFSLSRKF